MFTHVSRDEREERLHFSHLYKYVSAYEYTKEGLKELVEDVEFAVEKANELREPVIVDQDGEMCFHVHPNGNITLMLPWKRYKIIRE
jgi:hypothetical protein